MYVNKVGPFFNPHETYHYYQLPVCRPEKVNLLLLLSSKYQSSCLVMWWFSLSKVQFGFVRYFVKTTVSVSVFVMVQFFVKHHAKNHHFGFVDCFCLVVTLNINEISLLHWITTKTVARNCSFNLAQFSVDLSLVTFCLHRFMLCCVVVRLSPSHWHWVKFSMAIAWHCHFMKYTLEVSKLAIF